MSSPTAPQPRPVKRSELSHAQRDRLDHQVALLSLTSQRFIRACSDLLTTPGFTRTERDVVEFARRLIRLAASQREEITEPNVKGHAPEIRRRRHAEAARALQAAYAALDEASGVLDEALDRMSDEDKTARTWAKDPLTEEGLK